VNVRCITVDFLASVYAVNAIKPFTIAPLGFESVFRRVEDVRQLD
jgi:hypothetical protein